VRWRTTSSHRTYPPAPLPWHRPVLQRWCYSGGDDEGGDDSDEGGGGDDDYDDGDGCDSNSYDDMIR
jgi:hypothetical protein